MILYRMKQVEPSQLAVASTVQRGHLRVLVLDLSGGCNAPVRAQIERSHLIVFLYCLNTPNKPDGECWGEGLDAVQKGGCAYVPGVF